VQVRFLLFTLLSAAAFGDTLIGTVESIGKNQLRVKGPQGEVQLQADDKTTVRKARIFHDLSPLAVGDLVRVSYYGEGPGMVAVNISASVSLSGVISEAASMRLTVLPDSKTDARSADRKEKTFVFLFPDTRLGTSKKELTVGRRIQVVGWDAGDGVIEAQKIAISNTDARPTPSRLRQ
jgi:hypothetical protein